MTLSGYLVNQLGFHKSFEYDCLQVNQQVIQMDGLHDSSSDDEEEEEDEEQNDDNEDPQGEEEVRWFSLSHFALKVSLPK